MKNEKTLKLGRVKLWAINRDGWNYGFIIPVESADEEWDRDNPNGLYFDPNSLAADYFYPAAGDLVEYGDYYSRKTSKLRATKVSLSQTDGE